VPAVDGLKRRFYRWSVGPSGSTLVKCGPPQTGGGTASFVGDAARKPARIGHWQSISAN